MTKIGMGIPVATVMALLLLPEGLHAQEPDPAILDSLRVRIEEVSRRQMEEVRRVQEASQAEMAALRSALEAERGRITEAQRALTEAERALAAAQGGESPASRAAQVYNATSRLYTARSQYFTDANTSYSSARYLFPAGSQNLAAGSRSFVTSTGDNLGGAKMVSLNPALAAYFAVESGVLIVEVAEETAAARSGLRSGDVVQEVAGTQVVEIQEIAGVLRKLQRERLQELQAEASAQGGVAGIVSGSITYPIPLRVVREGREMDIVLEP